MNLLFTYRMIEAIHTTRDWENTSYVSRIGGRKLKVASITAVVSAISLAICLKSLHYFHLIKWNPVGFYKKWELFEGSSKLFQWSVLTILLVVIAFLLYVIMQLVHSIPAVLTSFLIGLLFAIIIEWVARDLPLQFDSLKKVSIPFLVVVICILRFLLETANFHVRVDAAQKGK